MSYSCGRAHAKVDTPLFFLPVSPSRLRGDGIERAHEIASTLRAKVQRMIRCTLYVWLNLSPRAGKTSDSERSS